MKRKELDRNELNFAKLTNLFSSCKLLTYKTLIQPILTLLLRNAFFVVYTTYKANL